MNKEIFDLPEENNAVISCVDGINTDNLRCKPENVLTVDFTDVVNNQDPSAFSDKHAEIIIDFIGSLADGVTDIYVCCSAGESRSPAIAAVLLLASGRDDFPVWRNPFYHPNLLVYERLCKAFGISADIKNKQDVNMKAFQATQNNHGQTDFERWEILF